ncbi:MAG: Na(+)-translocating NADH-quinone reductase subunit C [Alphaproteobacteria bacterium]
MSKNLWTKFKEVPLDNPVKTMFITVVICLVASLFVTYPALELRPVQEMNKLNEKRINILQVAGLYEEDKTIDEMFETVEAKVVDLRTGRFTDAVDANYDEIKALKSDEFSKSLTKDEDIASIRRQSYYKVVYLVKDAGTVSKVIIPIHGYGLWSTLYGFMAVKTDGNTITGLKFYSHGETPGLGGEVDNPAWQAQWPNKKINDASGNVAISVVKGGASGENQVDALSGATLTSVGVHNLVQFWVGKNGFKPFLEFVAQGGLK